MLDFAEIKKIQLTDVLGRYGIRLRFKGEWANAPCPLPTHKDGDKARSFTINLPQNYWRCFSESCNEKNAGRKGGDVINFVALMENCRERDAAQKLAEWYGLNGNERQPTPKIVAKSERNVNQNKTGPHMESRVMPKGGEGKVVIPTSTKCLPDSNPSAIAVKGYMQEIDAWFDELFGLSPEVAAEEYWKKARNGVKARLIQSYKNGQLNRAS